MNLIRRSEIFLRHVFVIANVTLFVFRFVLDGYPVTKKQVDLMTKRSIIPVRVIELTLDSLEVVTRATMDRYSEDKYVSDSL